VKTLIVYILSPAFYFIGHVCCVICHRFDSYILACGYQKFMCWSSDLEEWCEKEIVWKRVKTD